MDKLIVKKVQIEMLVDRGYDIPPEEIIFLTSDITPRFVKKYKGKSLNNFYKKNNETLFVYYMTQNKIIEDLKIFIDNIVYYDTGLIVGIEEGEFNKKKYHKLFEDLPFKPIETFTFDDLSYNVTKHVNYDQHELIDKMIIIPTLVDIDQLPLLLKSDPVCRYFNWSIGDVIKITRRYANLGMLNQTDIGMLNQTDIGYRVVTIHQYML